MLSKDQAQAQLKIAFPEVTIKAWTALQDFYLFRVEYPDLFEKDWDPFFSVDNLTAEVSDFSVVTDIDGLEFASLNWNDI